jgi:hypothetical protein
MLETYRLEGELEIAKYKTIDVKVKLEIESKEKKVLKASGELFFDHTPIQWNDKHPVKASTTGVLTLIQEGITSRFNILILDKVSEKDILPKQIKRYFWTFFVVGKPYFDRLELFPTNFGQINSMNKTFLCIDLPSALGNTGIVIASTEEQANSLTVKYVRDYGLDPQSTYSFVEIDSRQPAVYPVQDMEIYERNR